MNSLVAGVLNRLLGAWVQDLDSSSLQLSVLRGKVQLGPVQVRPQAIEELGLPFRLQHGSIDRVQVSIPWTALTSSPWIVEIAGINVVLTTRPESELLDRKREVEAFYQRKQYSLDQFELLPTSDISSDPGFAMRMVTRIIDNLQLTIRDLTVRLEYEGKDWGVEVGLGSFTVLTCNSEWNPEYVSGSSIINKVISSEDFHISWLTSQSTPIIHPMDTLIKLQLNKSDPEAPRFKADLELADAKKPLNLSIHPGFLTSIQTLSLYFSNYREFKTGVLMKEKQREMNTDDVEIYRELYRNWVLNPSDSTQLKEFERDKSLSDLIIQRKILKSRKSLSDLIVRKEESLKSLKNPKAGAVTWIKGWFVTQQPVEIPVQEVDSLEREIEELRKKQESEEGELERLLGEEKQEGNQAVELTFGMEKFGLTLFHHSTPALLLSISGLRSTISQSPDSLRLTLDHKEISLQQFLSPSSVFPCIAVFKNLRSLYSSTKSSGQLIDYRAKNSYVVYDVEVVKYVVEMVNMITPKDMDLESVSERVSAKTVKFIKLGRQSSSAVATQTSPGQFSVLVKAQAPRIYIPLSRTGECLVWDLGYVSITSDPRPTPTSPDCIHLSLKSTSLSLWSEVRSLTEAQSQSHIIVPFSLSTELTKSPPDSLFTLQTAIHVDPISIRISDDFLRFAFQLQEEIMTVLGNLTSKESIVEAVETTAIDIGQNLKVAMKERSSASPVDVKVRVEEVTVELVKEGRVFRELKLGRVSSGLTVAPNANMLATFRLQSWSISDPQSLQWPRILSSPSFPSSTSPFPLSPALLPAEMLAEHLKIGDETGLVDVRYSFKADGNETEIWVKSQPIDITINSESYKRLWEFIEVCKPQKKGENEVVSEIIHTNTALLPLEMRQNRSKTSVFCSNSSSSFSLKLDVGTIKLHIPESTQGEGVRVLGIELEVGINYAYEYTEELHFDEFGVMFRREVKKREDQADVNVFKVKGYFGRTSSSSQPLSHFHELLRPMRASTHYSYQTSTTDTLRLDLDIEVLEADISFRDIVSLQRIMRSFQSKPREQTQIQTGKVNRKKDVLYDVDVKVETMIVALVDDFGKVATPVLKSLSSNFSFTLMYSPNLFHLECCGALEIRYFNTSMVEWELLLEEVLWRLFAFEPVDMKDVPNEDPKPVTRVTFSMSRTAKVNLSLRMLESISELLKSLQFLQIGDHHDREGNQEMERIAEMTPQQWYMFQNKLGQGIEVVLGNTGTYSHVVALGSDAEEIVSKVELEKMLNLQEGQVQRRFGGHYYELVLPITLSLLINDSTVIEGIPIDGNTIHRFTVISGDYIYGGVIHKHNKGQIQLISFESLLKIVNMTDIPLFISANDTLENRELQPNYSLSAPLRWTEPSQSLYVGKSTPDTELSLLETIKIDANTNLVVDEIDLEVENSLEVLQVLILSAPLSIQNSLPYAITGVTEGVEVKCAPGGTVREMKVGLEERMWRWKVEEMKAETPDVPLGDGEHSYKLSGNMSADKVTVLKEKNIFSSCMDFDVSSYRQVRSYYNSRLAVLYAPYILINNTDYTLDFKAQRTFLQVKAKEVGFAVVTKPTFKVRLAGDVFGSTSSYSNKFNGSTVGLTGCLKSSHKHKVTPDTPDSISLGVTIEQAPWPLHLSKIMRVYPRFFLYNLSDADLLVKQENCERVIEAKRGKRVTFHFPVDGNEMLRLSEDGTFWSSTFSLDSIDSFQLSVRATSPVSEFTDVPEAYSLSELGLDPLCLKPTSPRLIRFLDVFVTTSSGAVLYLIIKNAQFPAIVLQNHTEELIEIWQSKGKQRMAIFPMSSIPFALEDIGDEKMNITLSTAGDRMNVSLTKEKVVKRKLAGFEVGVSVHKATKVVKIAPDPKEKKRKKRRQYPNEGFPSRSSSISSASPEFEPYGHFVLCHFELHFSGLEVSLIDGTPSELLVLTILGINATGSREVQDTDYRHYEYDFGLVIDCVQIDNMSTGEVEYPVLFCQKSLESSFCELKLSTKSTYQMSQNGGKLVSFQVRELYLGLQEMMLQVHQDTLLRLIEVINKIQGLFAYHTLARSDTLYLEAAKSSLTSIMRREIPGMEIGDELASKVFFETVELKAIKLTISYRTVAKKTHLAVTKQSSEIVHILGKVASAIVNISNSPLSFSTIILKKSFKSVPELLHSIMYNYIRQGAVQFFKLLGASELLGNPIGLVRKLGTGVYELFEEPMKGLKSPKDFAKGVGKGVRAFVSSAVSGSMESVSQVTGSLYRIVSQDQSASRTGQIGTEFQGSLQSFATSMAGLYSKPMEGAKSGVGGFVKGVGVGVYGAVTAPLSLVLRVSSNVTSNIADVTSFSGLTPLGRIRFPRYFGPKKRLLPYRREIAQAQQYLRDSGFPFETALFCIELPFDKVVLVTNSRIVVLVSGLHRLDINLADITRISIHQIDYQFAFIATTSRPIRVVVTQRFSDMGQLFEVLTALLEPITTPLPQTS